MRRALLAAPIALLLATAPAAHAANRFTLDAHASTPGHVLMNPPDFNAGTALVAWTSGDANTPDVCLIPAGGTCIAPITLRVPAGGEINGLFPVAMPDGTVALVGPRDEHKDVVRWTSDDGFSSPTVIDGSYPPLTSPQDVLAHNGDTWIGAVNNGLGIGGFGEDAGHFEFSDPGPNVKSGSLALDGDGRPVEAYFTLGGSLRTTRYSGGLRFDKRNWTEPETIAPGTEPVLTGGASGLFLASQDGTQLDLRRDTGSGFGAPVTLQTDANAELFDGGAATQAPNGRIAVVWPAHRSDGTKVLRAFVSTDGGERFAQSDIATIGDSYLVDRNASAGLANDGTGIVTFLDHGGLEVADTSPIAAPAPPPGLPTPPVPTPPLPRCVNGRTTAHLRGALVILRTTHVPGGIFVAQVSVRPRSLRPKVRFRYDGRPVHARTRLSALLRARPGTRHTLIASVSARGATRTLKLKLAACAS